MCLLENTKYVLFDLDGTLTEPSLGITNSVMYALKKFEIEVENRQKLYKFIGPPLVDSFIEYYGFTKENALKAVEYYREYYSVKGILENRLYDGIRELLRELYDNGKKIILATSKPQKFAEQILKHFEIDKYFCFVGAATMDEKRTQKDEVIEYILNECKIDTSSAVMIGDRKYDVLGAHKFGIKAIAVTFGFGSEEELVQSGADFIADTPQEISKFIK